MKVLLDTSPLKNGHSHRGIGQYTAQLLQSLNKISSLTVGETKEAFGDASPDIVHYPFFDLFQHTLPFKKAAKSAVVTIHDVIPLELRKYYPVGKKGLILFQLQKLALYNVQAIITDSIYSKQMIHKHLKIAEEKIFVVYLAANPEIRPVKEEIISKFYKEFDLPSRYVLYVGDINYNKNIPQLIKAIKYIPKDITLVLAGKNFRKQSIPEWNWIETQLALSDVTDRVRFITDFTDDPTTFLSTLYSRAACYVQPSLSEGFGLPVLEALQAHCPVVASSAGSLPEVGGSAVLYCDPTAESIAEKVKEILGWSLSVRSDKIKQGMNWATQFSWNTTALETLKVYESVYQKSAR